MKFSWSNYEGPNSLVVNLGHRLDVYFSYKTPVAYRLDGALVIRQNDWGATTNRHLKAIHPDKKRRVPGDQFERALEAVMEKTVRCD